MKLFKKLAIFVWDLFRAKINKKNIGRLTNTNPTIICSNCNGGILLHDLKLRFLTPTVNMFMYPKDFLMFLSDLHYYLSEDAELVLDGYAVEGYPIGRLIDIHIHLMHYKTFEEAKMKWDERSKRIQWDNIFAMMSERDGCTYEDMIFFDKLPYKKVIFTHKEYPEIKSSVYIKGFENEQCVGILSNKKNIFGKRYIDDFDYVSFLNEKS